VVPHCENEEEQLESQPVQAVGYAHVASQVRVMQVPGHPLPSTAPGEQTPSPAQVPEIHPQEPLQVSAWVPHIPHATLRMVPGAQGPSPAQAPQAPHPHDALQTRARVPQLPQDPMSTAPGAQTPSPVHAPKLPHAQLDWQVRVWVPHMPQD